MKVEVPAAPFVPIVRDYLDNYVVAVTTRGLPLSPLRILAARANIKRQTLSGLLDGTRTTLQFDAADRLLCAMNLVHLWRSSLADVYGSVHLRLADERRKARRKRRPGPAPKRKLVSVGS